MAVLLLKSFTDPDLLTNWKCIAICMFGVYAQAVLKLVYLDWRPIFLSNQIDKRYCDADYGKPSGHALTSTLLLPITLFVYFRPQSACAKLGLYSASLFVVCCIMFSRLYFAKHSLNQLLLGFTIGLFCHILLFVTLDSWLTEKIFSPLIHGRAPSRIEHELSREDSPSRPSPPIEIPDNDNETELQDAPRDECAEARLLFGLFVASNLLMVVGVIAAKMFVEFPESTFFQSFKNCLEMKDQYNSNFSSKVVRDGGAFNIFFGIYLAHYISQRRFQKRSAVSADVTRPVNIFQAMQTEFDDDTKNTIKRLIAIVLLLSPCLISFVVGPRFKGTEGVVINVLMGLGLPLLCGYMLRSGYICLLRFWKVPFFQLENSKTSGEA